MAVESPVRFWACALFLNKHTLPTPDTHTDTIHLCCYTTLVIPLAISTNVTISTYTIHSNTNTSIHIRALESQRHTTPVDNISLHTLHKHTHSHHWNTDHSQPRHYSWTRHTFVDDQTNEIMTKQTRRRPTRHDAQVPLPTHVAPSTAHAVNT